MSSLSGRTILLVSPQAELRRQLRVLASRHRAALVECRRAAEVRARLVSQRVDLILLDAGGDSTALEATRAARAHASLPLIALLATNDEQQRLAVLAAGADDCMTLPFESSELVHHMRAALELTQHAATETPLDQFAGALEVDFAAREVRLRGRAIHLTPTECRLLGVLLESAGKAVTRERLLREVWGSVAVQHVRQLRIHMKQLRRKFELRAPFARYLIAEPAVGYCLLVPA